MNNPATNRVSIPGHQQLQRSGIAVNPAVPAGSMAQWKRQAIQKAVSFGKLAPNWDSYGSNAPNMAVTQAAFQFLRDVPREDLPIPLIVPVSGGGLHFEWTVGHRELEVAIDPNGSIEMLRVQDGMPVEDEQISGISEIFGWLVE